MKRYKQANEGIHAPEKVKKNAVRRPRGRWMETVAAMLAVVIIGAGVATSLAPSNGPAPHTDGPGTRNASPLSGHALAVADYPEMAPYPAQEDFVSLTGDLNWGKYDKAYSAWRASRNALTPDMDFNGLMDDFLTNSTAQFLTDAGEENRIYSPLNVYMALSMLAETTGENTRRQILDLLQADSIETLRSRAAALWRANYRDDGAVTSILANSLWLRDGMTYSEKTLDTLASDYYASSFSGKMGSEEYDQALRDWLNEQTMGLLEEQANGLKLERSTVLALASAIYFKAAWDYKFLEGLTEQDVFHAPSGDLDVDFMRKDLEDSYYWGEHFGAVSLRFQEGGQMWLILPDEGCTVDQLLESGEAMEFLLADKSGYYDEETEQYVETWPDQKHLMIHLSMPKFDVSSDLDLIEGLQKLGVTDVFDWTVSNFDPLEASTDDPLYVSQAKHAARVKVDEEGCEAAAYTIIAVDAGAAPALPNDDMYFILDRPFLFAITGDSGLPLFVGAVNQPNG